MASDTTNTTTQAGLDYVTPYGLRYKISNTLILDSETNVLVNVNSDTSRCN